MSDEERVARLPSWVDKANIRKGLQKVTDKDGYLDWIEKVVQVDQGAEDL